MYKTLADYIGHTPLVRLQRLAGETTNTLLVKLEGNNQAGSVKDRPALNMIFQAEKRGDIKPGDTLIEATSGNTGIALYMAAAIQGYRMVLIMPENMSEERRAAMKAYGAELILVTQEESIEGARDLALQMQKEGADIIDIGGESTRPGAEPVSLDEELNRVIPVIEKIRQHSDVAISIDTSKPEVMQAAIKAGASMVNDVNALHAEGALEVCANYPVAVCLMHKQGNPQSMQENPQYVDIIDEIRQYLMARASYCIKAGIRSENIFI